MFQSEQHCLDKCIVGAKWISGKVVEKVGQAKRSFLISRKNSKRKFINLCRECLTCFSVQKKAYEKENKAPEIGKIHEQEYADEFYPHIMEKCDSIPEADDKSFYEMYLCRERERSFLRDGLFKLYE